VGIDGRLVSKPLLLLEKTKDQHTMVWTLLETLEQNLAMKNNITHILKLFFIVIIPLISGNCAYKNIPRNINMIGKNGLKQGIWLESNIEDNEERIILQYYKNGVLDGDYREFFPDGCLGNKGKYKNGIPIGRWEQYLNDGTSTGWQLFDKKGNFLKVRTVNVIW